MPAIRYEVLLTDGAERDIESIFDYVAEFDSTSNALRLLDRLLEVTASLSRFPERGSHPRELLALGIREYRQVMVKPYRIVYRTIERRVLVYLIADGRRDMQSLLARRLLGG